MPLKKENLSIIKKAMSKKSVGRVATGIPGFDELIQGGLPKDSSVLIAGSPGSGKTIFTIQYLVNGIEKYNEKGLFVTFEQKLESIRRQAMQFGWDLEKYEKAGKLKLHYISIDNISENTINDIRIIVNREQVKRLVIDSLSTLIVNAPLQADFSHVSIKKVLENKVVLTQPIVGDYILKRFLYSFVNNLRGLECTTLLIGETGGKEGFITRDTISSYISDGVILLSLHEALSMRRIQVRKMRETNHVLKPKEMQITKEGIKVIDDEEK